MYSSNIFWDGKVLRIQQKDKLVEYLSKFPDDSWFSIQVTPVGASNTTAQSKLYHHWCDILAKDFGWKQGNDFHTYFKDNFNNGQTTKGFDTKQWSEYMIKVQAFANEHQINLPTGLSE